jgi:hypothetical protein
MIKFKKGGGQDKDLILEGWKYKFSISKSKGKIKIGI